ncbi:hypothetical protein Lepto7375DRAFT_0944 [Leptolyngbya sp. PCC 7375]|nr:hypothetical protein Lepto7375DRAFT_0944 [Leptolyngbya sp. PCC 7375]
MYGQTITQSELLGIAFKVSMTLNIEAVTEGIEISYDDENQAKELVQQLQQRSIASKQRPNNQQAVIILYSEISDI